MDDQRLTFLGSPSYRDWSHCVTDMQNWVRRINEANGWFEKERPFSTDIALLHSEVSEAYEGYRNNDIVNVHEELADILIRLLDTCERLDVNLVEQFMRKCLKNANRGYRHGGKVE
jgi:NTP pyrophosphatase (non-canonical NTP hydrolase)